MKNIFIAFTCFIALYSCAKVKNDRSVTKIDTKVFIGFEEHKNDSIIFDMELGINSAFNLPPINMSVYKKETRIFYSDLFRERFYREYFDSGKLVSEIYNCKVSKIHDSMFMQIGSKIRNKIPVSVENLIDTRYLKKYKVSRDVDTGGTTLDSYYSYFIQIKELHSFNEKKILLVYEPFNKQNNDDDISHICTYLIKLNSKLKFNFDNSWDEILSKAFVDSK